jgi:hypothetical protein
MARFGFGLGLRRRRPASGAATSGGGGGTSSDVTFNGDSVLFNGVPVTFGA